MLSNVILFGVAPQDIFDHTQFFKDLPPQRKIPRAATAYSHISLRHSI